MKFIVDMNLSPAWCTMLRAAGHEAEHWSQLGDVRAPDRVLVVEATARGAVILTEDLDFGELLAAGAMSGPSVVIVSGQDLAPMTVGAEVMGAIVQFADALTAGALVRVEPGRARVRLLPITER